MGSSLDDFRIDPFYKRFQAKITTKGSLDLHTILVHNTQTPILTTEKDISHTCE